MKEQEFRELCIAPTFTLHDALERLNRTARGALLVVAADGKLLRTLTDGDMRRGRCDSVVPAHRAA